MVRSKVISVKPACIGMHCFTPAVVNCREKAIILKDLRLSILGDKV